MLEKEKDSRLNRKLYMIWYHMKSRCYDKNHERYHLYGGQGVIMCEDWLDVKTFREQVKRIDGYDSDAILNGLIHLDKDSILSGNKIYSPDTCVFIPKEMNNKFKPNQMIAFKATSKDGKVLSGVNQSEFAKKHGLSQSKISECLSGRRSSHKGWTFQYN